MPGTIELRYMGVDYVWHPHVVEGKPQFFLKRQFVEPLPVRDGGRCRELMLFAMLKGVLNEVDIFPTCLDEDTHEVMLDTLRRKVRAFSAA